MVKTLSTMLELGTVAPGFTLPDVSTGAPVSFGDIAGEKGTLVMFICNHCPFVVHVREELARIGVDYCEMQVGIVAISANDAEKYPEDSPAELAKMARELDFKFPLLFDESQEVAKSYTAACTPDFFVFDAKRRLVYRGQLDDSRPGNSIEVNGTDLRAALNALLEGVPPRRDSQKPSLGCNIKWRPGNEPDYFR